MRWLLAQMPSALGLLPLVLALALWQFFSNGPAPNFPAPSMWWTAGVQLATRGVLVPAVLSTLWTFFVGLAIASALGFVLGLLIGTLATVRNWLGLLLEYLRALPPPVIVPVAALIMGYSTTMKISVVVITAIWPVLLNTIAGVAQVRELLLDVATSLRMPWRVRVTKIVLPATIPAFLIGVRVAVPLAVVIALLVEMLTGLPGIGRLMIAGQRNYNSSQVFALLAIVGVLGFLLNLAFAVLEGAVLRRWPPRFAPR
jgi:ABC-type nitrate/sulfonate/bicarbonate transport system permease component